jgi:beta-lactam-binding protein with PASTA domain
VLKIITGKPLWINIVFSLVLLAIVLLLFLVSLNLITRHGSTLTIPSVTGKSYAEATKILNANGFDVELQDSTYNDTAAALSVLRQFPEADEVVKKNRTVYLTINRSVAPTIEMPMLEGLSFRNAEIVIKQYGLKRGDTIYRTDYAKNSVLEQIYDGERIKPGTKIRMGSVIKLVLGTGEGRDEFTVPDLFGMSYQDARVLIESTGLTMTIVGVENDVSDTTIAFVQRQQPEKFTPDLRTNRIRLGQNIDVWLSAQRPVRKETDTLSH